MKVVFQIMIILAVFAAVLAAAMFNPDSKEEIFWACFFFNWAFPVAIWALMKVSSK